MQEVVSLKISSNLKNIAQIERLLENWKEEHNISDDKFGNILLASVEAVTNAMEHGNLLDEAKTVAIEVCKCESSFQLKVKDQGKGFNPEQLHDPILPEFKECPDGRGVFLMKQLADELHFHDGGRCVEMKFFLS